jgi:hypothetical protein
MARAAKFFAYLAISVMALLAAWFVVAVMLPAIPWLWLQVVAACYLGVPIVWFFWIGIVGMWMEE